jgi:DNA-damage-inducible protein J
MATVQTQIRIDANTKKEVTELLEGWGMSLSEAVNIYLRQIILQKKIPFEISNPRYKDEVIEAMEESKRIANDPNVKKYTDVHEMFKEILNDE